MSLYSQYQDVFQEYGIEAWPKLARHWQEPHRHYHGEGHLAHLLAQIEHLHQAGEINQEHRKILLMAAFYHDAIYDPRATNNEEKSAELFLEHADSHPNTQAVKEIILDTQTHQPSSELSALFSDLDMQIVRKASFSELLAWEKAIFKEYQFVDYSIYKKTRLDYLAKWQKQYAENATNLGYLIEYLEQHRPKIGIYPGSFNPFHNGHLNILEKAERIFDKVIVARGINPDKQDINEDVLQLKTLRYRQVENFSGFLTKYLSSKEGEAEITLIRGLRNGDDLDYEVNQLRFMEEMKPEVKIIFLPCDKEFEHISSSSIKNLDRIDAEFSKKYKPE